MVDVVVWGGVEVTDEAGDVEHRYVQPDDPRATEWFVLIDHGQPQPYEFPAQFSYGSLQEAVDAAKMERTERKAERIMIGAVPASHEILAMSLRKWVQAWWIRDLGETVDAAAYERFREWLANPRCVKPYDWNEYTLADFYADMHRLRDRGDYEFKHPAITPMGSA